MERQLDTERTVYSAIGARTIRCPYAKQKY
jgi:hypothetical protein